MTNIDLSQKAVSPRGLETCDLVYIVSRSVSPRTPYMKSFGLVTPGLSSPEAVPGPVPIIAGAKMLGKKLSLALNQVPHL